MKTLKFFYLLFSFLIICNLSIFAISSEFDYPIVEKDSLFAQDTTIIEFDVGHYDPEMLRGVLSPYIVYWPDDCYECKEDSIWSLQTTLFEDTTFHFTFAVPHGSVPGIYRFSVIFGENSRVGGKNITIVTRPFIYQQPVGDTVCEGDTVKFEVKVLRNYGDEMNYQWYQNDEPFRSGRVTEMKPLIFALDTGSYYCRVSGYGGLDTSITVRLDWFEAPSKLSAPEGPVHFCPGSDTISYFIHSDPLSMGYNWHLTPDAAGTILQYDTAAQVIWDPAYSGLASLYVILESVCEVVTESLDIYVQGKSVSPDICIAANPKVNLEKNVAILQQ